MDNTVPSFWQFDDVHGNSRTYLVFGQNNKTDAIRAFILDRFDEERKYEILGGSLYVGLRQYYVAERKCEGVLEV